MKKIYIHIIMSIVINTSSKIYPHCQVPCGIYDDKSRVLSIYEDLKTINKSMVEITSLSKNSDSLSGNQMIRWVTTKEEHAKSIQETVSEYFMAQRIKEKDKNYNDKLMVLHKILKLAMKCKQGLNFENVNNCEKALLNFCELYFQQDDFNQIKSLIE